MSEAVEERSWSPVEGEGADALVEDVVDEPIDHEFYSLFKRAHCYNS